MLSLPSTEIIEHSQAMLLLSQLTQQVRADKTCPASDQNIQVFPHLF
jgi:hypothetical protein